MITTCVDWNEALASRFFYKFSGEQVFFKVRQTDIFEISRDIGLKCSDEKEAMTQFIDDVMRQHPPTKIQGKGSSHHFGPTFEDIFENGACLADGNQQRIGYWWERKDDGELCDDSNPNYKEETEELFQKAPPFLSHLAIAIIAKGMYPGAGLYDQVCELGEEFVSDWSQTDFRRRRIAKNWKEFCKKRIPTPKHDSLNYLWRHLSHWGEGNGFGRLVSVPFAPGESHGYVCTAISQVLFGKEDLPVLARIYDRRKWSKASREPIQADIIYELSTANFRTKIKNRIDESATDLAMQQAIVQWVLSDIRHWDGKVPSTDATSPEEISIQNFKLEIAVTTHLKKVSDFYVRIENVMDDKQFLDYDYVNIGEDDEPITYPVGDLIEISGKVAKSIAGGAPIFLSKGVEKEDVKFSSRGSEDDSLHLIWDGEGYWLTSNIDDNQQFLTLSDILDFEGLEEIARYDADNTAWEYAIRHKSKESLTEEQRREYGINNLPQDIDIPKLTVVGGIKGGHGGSYLPHSPPYLRKKHGNVADLDVRIDGGGSLDFDEKWNGFRIPPQTNGEMIKVVASEIVKVDDGDDEIKEINSWQFSFANPLERWDSDEILTKSIKSHYCGDVSGARLLGSELTDKLSGDNSWVSSPVNTPSDSTVKRIIEINTEINKDPDTEISYNGLSEQQISEITNMKSAVRGGRSSNSDEGTSPTPTEGQEGATTPTEGQNIVAQVPNNNGHKIPDERVLTIEDNPPPPPPPPKGDVSCVSCGTPCVGKRDTKFPCPELGCGSIIFRCRKCRNQARMYRCRSCKFEGP